MIVCICANINDRAAEEFLFENSVADFARIQGVKQSCGKCMKTVKEIKKKNNGRFRS